MVWFPIITASSLLSRNNDLFSPLPPSLSSYRTLDYFIFHFSFRIENLTIPIMAKFVVFRARLHLDRVINSLICFRINVFLYVSGFLNLQTFTLQLHSPLCKTCWIYHAFTSSAPQHSPCHPHSWNTVLLQFLCFLLNFFISLHSAWDECSTNLRFLLSI